MISVYDLCKHEVMNQESDYVGPRCHNPNEPSGCGPLAPATRHNIYNNHHYGGGWRAMVASGGVLVVGGGGYQRNRG
ncbi:hypothetical protein LXL04_005301 [Taraxacum kok-saghyz]